MMKRSDYTHNGSFSKSFGLLLKALLTSIGYGLLWFGILLLSAPWGLSVLIVGSVICALALFLFIIVPISRLK